MRLPSFQEMFPPIGTGPGAELRPEPARASVHQAGTFKLLPFVGGLLGVGAMLAYMIPVGWFHLRPIPAPVVFMTIPMIQWTRKRPLKRVYWAALWAVASGAGMAIFQLGLVHFRVIR